MKQICFSVTLPQFDSNNILVRAGYVPRAEDFWSLGQEQIGQMAFGTITWMSSRSAHKVKSLGLDPLVTVQRHCKATTLDYIIVFGCHGRKSFKNLLPSHPYGKHIKLNGNIKSNIFKQVNIYNC